MATTPRRSRSKSALGSMSVKSLTNFTGIQNDAITVVSLLAGMLAGKFINDNVKSAVGVAGMGNFGNSTIGRLAGDAVSSVKGAIPAALLLFGGFALRKNVKNSMLRDAGLGIMGYGAVSAANDLFKFNLVSRLQGFGRKGLGSSLYQYVDRPRVLEQETQQQQPQQAYAGVQPVAGMKARAV
jgi:hypothetical protein